MPCGEYAGALPVRAGNYAYRLACLLRDMGAPYRWTWAHAHRGYRVFDEGEAVFSRAPIQQARARAVSARQNDSPRYCPRVIVGVRAANVWYYALHMGWWNDCCDPFSLQWERALAFLRERGDGAPVYLLGDFNNPAHRRGEGYDRVLEDGFIDCFTRAHKRDAGVTVGGQIDGWRKEKVDPMRIDLCLSDRTGETLESRVIFDGAFYPVISDHFGVLTRERLPAHADE